MPLSPEMEQEALEAYRRQRQRLQDLTKKMEPEEVELLSRVVASEANHKYLVDLDYEREPVSVRQFIFDDFYLGKIMCDGVFDILVNDGEELFAGQYTEVVMGGGIGFGKTRFIEIAIAYDIYKVTCLRDPARAYGMISGSNITFVNISVNKQQATKVFFQGLYDLLARSPYFNSVARFDKKLRSEIRFLQKNIRCYPVAASEQAALGTGVFCACIDEANFMDVIERSKRGVPGDEHAYDQAEAVFHKLSSRIRSRMANRGRLPGHLYVASSARYPDDFVERLMKQAEKERAEGIHEMFTRRYATYETNRQKFSKETFKVEVGDITRRSRVLVTPEDEQAAVGRVIEVPMDFWRPFDQDPDRAVRDVAGFSVMSIKPFLSQREKVHRMFELGEVNGLKHPFTRDNVTLQQKDPALEKLIPERLHWIEQQKMNPATGLPMFDKGKPMMEKVLFPSLYNVHVDLSKRRDATGLVIAHNVAAIKVQRMNPKSAQLVEESKPVIRIDLVLRIIAPKNGEVNIPRVRAILYELNRVYKIQFGRITFDTYQSQESVMTLRDEGFNADILSMDKDMTPYETLRTALYDERVQCYHNQILERELVQLEQGEKKIDHPATHGGSKDLADALAGVIYNCEESWRSGEGARGLFQLGIVEHAGELSPRSVQERQAEIYARTAEGIRPTGEDENDMLFGGLEQL